MKKSLSFIIITKNEEDWIENCLLSIKDIAEEIIVIDVGSTDKTIELCKKYTKLIFTRDWHGYSPQKNYAITKASGDWLFFIDADERLSPKLRAEIKNVIEDPNAKSAYQVPRLNYLLGVPMRHGGWWPDLVTRLAKKEKIDKWTGELHEELRVKGETGTLKNPLYHLTHRGVSWMLNKSIKYTHSEALLRFNAGHPKIVWWRFFRVMFGEFWDRYIKKLGFLDGTVGLIEAISQSYNMFLIYVQVWEMQKGKSMDEIYKEIDKELKSGL